MLGQDLRLLRKEGFKGLGVRVDGDVGNQTLNFVLEPCYLEYVRTCHSARMAVRVLKGEYVRVDQREMPDAGPR
ncbi:hypothetical protein SAMN05443639_11382 [Stigmatella erecta]|uniref:Uncharacterized protein n=1 Tax=Stigmatella erecta TaxID=83460 RepID=A0A1I0KR77_9BACT|nr:hypothetical protein SAMN05443639_11382 [Stigmatella erecta]